jgi:CheY-like chemotaxis protein
LLLEDRSQDLTISYKESTALEMAAALPPHVAFIDISMPEIDGREIARRLQQLFAGDGMLLVAITGVNVAIDPIAEQVRVLNTVPASQADHTGVGPDATRP